MVGDYIVSKRYGAVEMRGQSWSDDIESEEWDVSKRRCKDISKVSE